VFAILPLFSVVFSTGGVKKIQIIYQYCFNVLYALNLAFIIITNIVRISRNNKLAIFYASANVPVIIGTLIYYTNYFNLTNIQFGWFNPVALGLSIETFVLSFGFAYRFNFINKEKRKLLLQINKQQREITQQIIATQEAERKRIAEDLHDELGSDLAVIKLNLQSKDLQNSLPAEKYEKVLSLVDKAGNDARRIAHNLMPPEFNETKLHDIIAAHISSLNKNDERFQFSATGKNGHFNKQQELFIYRIIIELTHNIVKHAAASESGIQLIYYADHLEIMVEDNGIGFSNKTDGTGLKSIQSRVSYLNGNMNIDSGIYGTTVLINIPYEQKNGDN
jgi:signal transduction histidine kinase